MYFGSEQKKKGLIKRVNCDAFTMFENFTDPTIKGQINKILDRVIETNSPSSKAN